MDLYTKNGRPLQISGDVVYGRTGKVVGKMHRGKVHGPDGRYVGTIVKDRLVHRSADSASVRSPFSRADRAGSGKANRAGAGVWGDEPDIPD